MLLERTLLTETGGLMIGPSDSKTVAGALRSAQSESRTSNA